MTLEPNNIGHASLVSCHPRFDSPNLRKGLPSPTSLFQNGVGLLFCMRKSGKSLGLTIKDDDQSFSMKLPITLSLSLSLFWEISGARG